MAERTDPTSRPARVLIAEDNPQGAELIEAFLADSGWETQTVADGEATLTAVRDWRPDLLLLDIMMPKLSGFEVCKQIRANPNTRSLPVLMITALDQPSDIERAVEVGTDDFLTKPINKTDLVLRISALLKSRREQGELSQTLAYMDAVGQPGP